MNRFNVVVLIVAISLVVTSCAKDDNTNTGASGLTYSYFPIDVGHTLYYDVELITKDEFSGNEDTSYYQLKEYIESVFTDNQGRPTRRIERYERPTSNDPWIIADVWTVNMTSQRVEKKEDNITFIKMVFPISNGKNWNGNSLNTLDEEQYEYMQINQPDNQGSLTFDSTLVVLQLDEDNFIYKEYKTEKYATGVGLYYKEQTRIDYDYSNPGIVEIKSQRLYKEKLTSWNN